ncbi:MAG: hypothetical protein KZQ94_16035 [Candidatus Thiodiazotropha sp. (ex Troendleina suluensis)]|nr:hypothetical protein [Candidatus Thiodiazotropha sp. (ex Troendleina suluensis)]
MMKIRPLYIFDLDGTLALIDHRRHILDDEDSQKWRRFYAACDKDKPNIPVIATMEFLRQAGADVWIFSGRSDEVRDKTVAWIAYHTSFMTHDLDTVLTMRSLGDYTGDDVLKRQWLDSMLVDDRKRLIAAFDDRDRVVKMWRDAGVACFQVAAGNF